MRHSDWFMYFILFCLIGGCATLIVVGGGEEHRQTVNRIKWREYHHCQVISYAGEYPTPVYKCDDGRIYIFRDLPEME